MQVETTPTTYYTVKQVAQRLQFSERQVRKYIATGEMPALKFERALRIPADGLNEWLERHFKTCNVA
jgi:excisionase family DNA binding protein